MDKVQQYCPALFCNIQYIKGLDKYEQNGLHIFFAKINFNK